MKHLLLFTLGPVQSFIAQARKTHDLYAGSLLLSNLVEKAIDVVGENNLIFPKKGEAMPNRFLARVPENETNLKAFGERIEKIVREEWAGIAKKVLDSDRITKKPNGFDEQIDRFLEIFWVIEPLESDEKYQETISALNKNLAAIKNSRPFSQYSWQDELTGEQGRKCNLDGQRNVQFYRPKNGKDRSEISSPLYSTPNGVFISTTQFHEAILQPGEGLSAVSFVKRRYQYTLTSKFKSTAEIALLDALTFLSSYEQTIEGCIRLHEYKSAFSGGFNAQLYFEEGLSDRFLESQGIQPIRNLNDLRVLRKKCLEDLAKANGYKFQKYYAVLTFDGDDMGKWLSGKKLTDQYKLMKFQESLAECLADFAKHAKQLLDKDGGQTVYAGGDDFLGFVNLNHLLPLLKDLYVLFHEKVDLPLASFKTDKISFSAGICVAHYKEPLSLVLHEAQKAQKEAKSLDGKDAFAISVIKGSGENHTTVLPFEANAGNVIGLQLLTESLIKEDFSNNFIKTMRLEFERVMDFKGSRATFEQLFQTELKRLLQRAANKNWGKENKLQEVEKMSAMLWDLFGIRATENFFQMLHIADFFQREMDTLPKGTIKEPQTI